MAIIENTALAVSDERALIGCLLADPSMSEKCADVVYPHDFVDQALGQVFAFLCSLGPNQDQDRLAFVRHPAIKAVGIGELIQLEKDCIDPSLAVVYAEDIHQRATFIPEDEDAPVKRGGPLLRSFADKVLAGKRQPLLDIPRPLHDLEIGPGLITIVGAGPGAGKTTMASQVAFGHLENTKVDLVHFANAEMTFDSLLMREVTRRTSLPYRTLREGSLDTAQRMEFNECIEILAPLCERVRWYEPPFNISTLMECEAHSPSLLIVDYLQKFAPTDCDARAGVGRVMAYLRYLAKQEWAVLALSATSRTSTKKGSGHDGQALSMASFRESSEVEFNADSCYLLRHVGDIDGESWLRDIQLDCVKNRHGDLETRSLVFNAAGFRFEAPAPSMVEWCPVVTPTTSEQAKPFTGSF